jgi:hypothetical protein
MPCKQAATLEAHGTHNHPSLQQLNPEALQMVTELVYTENSQARIMMQQSQLILSEVRTWMHQHVCEISAECDTLRRGVQDKDATMKTQSATIQGLQTDVSKFCGGINAQSIELSAVHKAVRRLSEVASRNQKATTLTFKYRLVSAIQIHTTLC